MCQFINDKNQNYITSVYTMRIGINNLGFQLYSLRFEYNYFDYVFNTLVNHKLHSIEDNTKYSNIGIVTPLDLKKLDDKNLFST